MTTTTYMPNAAREAIEAGTSPRAGLFSRILAAIVEVQNRKAERAIAGHLVMLSNDRLAALGLSPAETAAVRTGAPIRDVIDRRWRSAA